MLKTILTAGSELSLWPALGLIIFFILFVIIVVKTFRMKTDLIAHISRLPLTSDHKSRKKNS